MRVLYIDSLFFLEAAADALLLWSAGKLCGARRRWWRLLAAALLGAAYAVLAALWRPAAGWACRAAALAAMLLAAYGGERRLWRLALAFLFMAAVYGGIAAAIAAAAGTATVRALLFAMCFSVGVCALPFRFAGRKGGVVRLRIRQGEREVTLAALLDTGSALREPLSGAGALVASEQTLAPLLTERQQAVLRETRGLPAADRLLRLGPGFRLLPYRTVSGAGFLPAFRPEAVYVEDAPVPALWAALSPEEIRTPEGCEALLGGKII